MKKIVLITVFLLLVFPKSFAEDLDSTNYRLVSPSSGETANGPVSSPTFSILVDSSPVDDFTTTSTNYTSRGGTASFTEPKVPQLTCFETSTSSGTCSSGSNGMQEVCSAPGCYDRAKFRIDTQSNPSDTRYAIQVSTTSNFSSDIFYVDGVSRLLKVSLTITDFLYACDWEGTTLASYCASPNTTWQRYNVLGLTPGTTYYARVAALHGSPTNGSYTQTTWGPSLSVATQNTSLSIDIDIAASVAGSSSPPYLINLGTMTAGSVTTSTNYIIVRHTTNALFGTRVLIRGLNGGLTNGVSTITAVNADLASNDGYGLRNDSTTNSQNYGTFIGTITVSTTPNNFADTGGADRVGAPSTTFNPLFTSNSLPLHTGVSGYRVKAKPNLTHTGGSYSEDLTYIPLPVF